MINTKAWLQAARLRTLPLAIAGIVLGGFLAHGNHKFSLSITLLAVLTAIALQVLSNFANDYGDFIKGTDNDQRVGPTRALQSGAISQKAMKIGLYISGSIAFILGITTLYLSFGSDKIVYALLFLLIGLGAIWAAIKYTVGTSAYGYKGLGDFFVFIFFGWVAVVGTYFLNTQSIDLEIFLPASIIGFMSAGVLNLNNMRDIKNDANSQKNTLAVKLGLTGAKYYHFALFVLCVLFSLGYDFQFGKQSFWGSLGLIPALLVTIKVSKTSQPEDMDPFLKIQALGTFIFALVYGFSQV